MVGLSVDDLFEWTWIVGMPFEGLALNHPEGRGLRSLSTLHLTLLVIIGLKFQTLRPGRPRYVKKNLVIKSQP